MGRLILILVIIAAAFWLLRRAVRPRVDNEAIKRASDLIRCARCGINLPRDEARAAPGGLYCSDEHARLGAGSESG